MRKHLVRLICLACALMMICGVALAEAPSVSIGAVANGSWAPPYNHNDWKHLLTINVSQAASLSATVYDSQGVAFNTPKINGNYTANLPVQAGNLTLNWPAVNYQGWHPGDGSVEKFKVVVSATNENGTGRAETEFNFYFRHDITQHKTEFDVDPNAPVDPNGPENPTEPVIPDPIWYANNTVCSFGPHFRDVSPEMTDKWYMFTALDLSQDGVQCYELVSGNVFVIGEVVIEVKGDNLTVSYSYCSNDILDEEQFFTIFGDYNDITTVEPAQLNRMEYNKTYSIQNDLGGDTSVVLFVCNRASVRDDTKGIVRFWENIDWRKELREAMLTMIGK